MWTGSEIVVLGGTSGDRHASPVAAALDPRSGSWRVLRGLDDVFGFAPTGAAWDGNEVLALGSLSLCPELGSVCSESRPIFVAYDPKADARREIDLAGAPWETSAPDYSVAWTGSEVAFANYQDPSAGVVRYDPATGSWRSGTQAPCRLGPASFQTAYFQTAWLGDRLVVPCGPDRLQVYDLPTDTWARFAAGPSPLNARSGSAIVWTGFRPPGMEWCRRRTREPVTTGRRRHQPVDGRGSGRVVVDRRTIT